MSITSNAIGQIVHVRNGHDNFFTPLRLIFALLVMIGHAFAIAHGDADREPQVFFHYTFSYLAVNLFFITSGFLVTKSMLYRGDSPAFVSARVLRIFPALAVHVFFRYAHRWAIGDVPAPDRLFHHAEPVVGTV